MRRPPPAFRAPSAPLALLLAALVSAAPARADVLTVYDDALAASFADWSWATHSLASTTSPHGGSDCISMTATGWTGIYFHNATALAFSNYDSLDVWVRGSQANEQVQFVLQHSGTVLGSVTLQSYVAGGTIGTSWVKATVPLRTIASDSPFDELVFQAATSGSEGTLYFDDMRLYGGSNAVVAPDTVLVTVDPRLDRHAVSPLIYGVNFADSAGMAALHYPVNRWGGNSTTRYSWQVDASNHASDWFFLNEPENTPNPATLPNGSTADYFVSFTRSGGGVPLVTVPMIGWAPKDRTKRWGYSVAKYGAQQQTECTASGYASWCAADAGNGVSSASGLAITGNDPLDTSVPVGTAFASGWLAHLAGQFGHAGAGGVRYYALDNEPALWNSTHHDVHPAPVSYDELWSKTLDYATAIKTAEPAATVLGPAAWGWCEYFYSAADGCAAGSDAAAHGGTPLLEWYLQQVRARQLATGVRPVDLLDVHYYPQAGNVYSTSESVGALRLRSLKSLYDPEYVDESWIGQPVQLIPRMKAIIAARCPGVGLAISEYSFGDADNGITCALAQAEALAIFAREGVDLATRWVAPANGSRLQDAFRVYLNYDGAGAAISGQNVRATSASVDRIGAYAEQAASGRLFVLLFNKDASDVHTRVTLADGATGPVTLYRFTAASALAAAGTASFTGSRLELTLPAQSATLAVVERGQPADVPAASTGGAGGLQLAVRANPMRGPGTIAFVLPRASHVTLTLHDVAGRRVRTLLDGESAAGPRSVAWNGDDDGGRALPSGAYLCRLSAAGRTETCTVVRLR